VNRVDTVHFRHLNIKEGHIRSHQTKLLDRLEPVGSLGKQLHIGLIGQHCGQALAKDRMIINR
jgi:hypothetical protein